MSHLRGCRNGNSLEGEDLGTRESLSVGLNFVVWFKASTTCREEDDRERRERERERAYGTRTRVQDKIIEEEVRIKRWFKGQLFPNGKNLM